MPSVAQESPTVPTPKKRRRDDNGHQIPFATNTPRGIFADRTVDHGGLFQHHHPSPSASRKMIPLPHSKRLRTTVDIDIEADGEPMQRLPFTSPSHKHHQHHQPQRPHHQTKDAPREELGEQIRSPPSAAALPHMNRCHICSRKPNKKSDLDSFGDCQGCGQRACYVCIRECLGWGPNIQPPTSTTSLDPRPPATETTTTTTTSENLDEGETSFTMLDADDAEDHPPERTEHHEQGWTRGGGHRQVVCSRCCVERGEDGDVVCLGCLLFVEG
ncbi:hypothetical protein C8A00DRAFT_19305 [Chaetomidium leptoderma]|uniref:Uncharacterized protein n=1 Tax=Chaetomidium leptoderma TaxID=669021 RepID=A0AAN6VF12_9PEZI|nr:hypothetical protein C8A00DRAFT_19305 [Chaetomidium leptoderma]